MERRTNDPERAPRPPARPSRRPSRRTLKIASAFAATAAFALPWGVLHATPAPPTVLAGGAQVVALPNGQRIVIPQGPIGATGVRYVYVKGSAPPAAQAPPAATTSGSRP